jgi:hypothetical protein
MMNKFLFRRTFFLALLYASLCQAQTVKKINLQTLLKNNKLVVTLKQDIKIINEGSYNGISLKGIVWLKGETFSTGSIDVDLRGRDVLQQSFLGIAFHGIDTVTYDAIYFRPFNFQSADTLRRKHCVEYISEPDYPWYKLRQEHPLVYENAVTPRPAAAGWFHTHIVVDENEISVYVNHSATASLIVKKLNTRNDGLIGLWTDSLGLNGDFANLEISANK